LGGFFIFGGLDRIDHEMSVPVGCFVRARKISSSTKEHVVSDSWQEKDIVQPVDHERAEEEPQHPSLVLFDVTS
jgi:hypothetical protein